MFNFSVTCPKQSIQPQFEFKGPKPPNKEAIIEWFRSSEIARRAGLEADRNVVAPWFHGEQFIISKLKAII